MDKLISIIIYGYNEGENAPGVVEESFSLFDKAEISGEVIFVDDGSEDDTAGRMNRFHENPGFRYAAHERNRGIGAAIRTGAALADGEWTTALPADGQVPPGELAKLLDASTDVSLVVSRFPERFKTADDVTRRIFSTGFHLMCRLFMGGGWGMDGVWLARSDMLKDLRFTSDTFVANIEIPVRLIRRGAKWKRVDVRVRKRERGASKIFSSRRIVRVGGEIIRAGLDITWTK